MIIVFFFLFKHKTAYEMRISDWSSDVCSSDLIADEAQILMANILRRPPNWKAHWLEDKVWRGLAKPRKSAIARAIAAGRPMICRSEERSVGKVCVSTCRSRLSPHH